MLRLITEDSDLETRVENQEFIPLTNDDVLQASSIVEVNFDKKDDNKGRIALGYLSRTFDKKSEELVLFTFLLHGPCDSGYINHNYGIKTKIKRNKINGFKKLSADSKQFIYGADFSPNNFSVGEIVEFKSSYISDDYTHLADKKLGYVYSINPDNLVLVNEMPLRMFTLYNKKFVLSKKDFNVYRIIGQRNIWEFNP